jgi:ABC-2 type transport system permease protein
MNRALIRKSIAEARLLLVSSTLVMFAVCWLRVWIVSLLPTDFFKTLLEQFRDFERFVPVPFEQLFTYPGRLALTYDELIVVMCVVIWAIARGSDVVAGELGRGTMEMLLAQPVSRVRILVTQSAVTVVGIAILATASWLGLYVGIQVTSVEEPVVAPRWSIPMWGFSPGALPDELPLEGESRRVPMSSKVNPRVMIPAAVNLFALGFFLAGLSALMSSMDRYRWRAIGIVAAIYVVQFIVKIVALASDRLNWLSRLTFFSAYEPGRFVSVAVNTPEQTWKLLAWDEQGQWSGLGPLGLISLLIVMGLMAYVAAAWIFRRRDLPAPM